MRTEVAIIGAGPAGRPQSPLLAADGVESVVLETRSRDYVAARIRAVLLESSTVDVLAACGLDGRLREQGLSTAGYTCSGPRSGITSSVDGATSARIPNQAKGYVRSQVRPTLEGIAFRLGPNDPSQPAMASTSSRCSRPSMST